MKYVGVDLHKKIIRLCVVVVVRGQRKITARRGFSCQDTENIRAFFAGLGQFQAVVEATAHYGWFFGLIEDLADRLVLAHPKKLRIIAESTRKTDKIDAEVLAVFLALDMIPGAYRPTPRIRQYRVLVRHRCRLQRRITSIKTQLRNKLADYNADVPELFTEAGAAHLAGVKMTAADRFEASALQEQQALFAGQLHEADRELVRFACTVPVAEREALRPAGQHSPGGHGDDRRGAQRVGRLATFSFPEGSGGVFRIGSRRAAERRQASRPAHQQAGLAAAALGHDPSGVAFVPGLAALAAAVGEAGEQYWLEEEGDCGRRPPPGNGVLRDPA